MPVRLVPEENILTAYLSGEIDHHAAKDLRDAIDEQSILHKPEKLLLDFREVTFMDSSGIGLVMGRYRLMQELGGVLRVAGVPSHIRKVMRLSGLDKLAVMEPEGKHPGPPSAKPPVRENPRPEIMQTASLTPETGSQGLE